MSKRQINPSTLHEYTLHLMTLSLGLEDLSNTYPDLKRGGCDDVPVVSLGSSVNHGYLQGPPNEG